MMPCETGSQTVYIPLFAPVASTPFLGMLGFLSGQAPEFVDPHFIAKSEGRECKALHVMMFHIVFSDAC
jgi:B9 domain-containing protein 1